MLYHIFHPTVYFPLWQLFWFVWLFFRRRNEWLLKDDSDNILYSMTYDSKIHPHVKHLYRATPDLTNRIASIHHISDTIWLIKRSSEEDGRFFEPPCFEHAGTKYCWSGRSTLMDKTGTTIVEFKPSSWRYTKVGELSMVEMDEDLREMALATMVAMDWRVRIEAQEKARREFERWSICEELRKVCEGQNRGIACSGEMKRCLKRLNEYLGTNGIETTSYNAGPRTGRCKWGVESPGCGCEVVSL
jgi:hypothetical protein